MRRIAMRKIKYDDYLNWLFISSEFFAQEHRRFKHLDVEHRVALDSVITHINPEVLHKIGANARYATKDEVRDINAQRRQAAVLGDDYLVDIPHDSYIPDVTLNPNSVHTQFDREEYSAKKRNGKKVSPKHLADEYEVTPQRMRKILRDIYPLHERAERWEWTEGTKEIKDLREELNQKFKNPRS